MLYYARANTNKYALIFVCCLDFRWRLTLLQVHFVLLESWVSEMFHSATRASSADLKDRITDLGRLLGFYITTSTNPCFLDILTSSLRYLFWMFFKKSRMSCRFEFVSKLVPFISLKVNQESTWLGHVTLPWETPSSWARMLPHLPKVCCKVSRFRIGCNIYVEWSTVVYDENSFISYTHVNHWLEVNTGME